MPRKNRPGVYVPGTAAGEKYQAFIPHTLPPDPSLQLTTDDYDLIEKANGEINPGPVCK
jgi:hypothetical protein